MKKNAIFVQGLEITANQTSQMFSHSSDYIPKVRETISN
jgi:hypothetical protein